VKKSRRGREGQPYNERAPNSLKADQTCQPESRSSGTPSTTAPPHLTPLYPCPLHRSMTIGRGMESRFILMTRFRVAHRVNQREAGQKRQNDEGEEKGRHGRGIRPTEVRTRPRYLTPCIFAIESTSQPDPGVDLTPPEASATRLTARNSAPRAHPDGNPPHPHTPSSPHGRVRHLTQSTSGQSTNPIQQGR
jgi:hypothetical protein